MMAMTAAWGLSFLTSFSAHRNQSPHFLSSSFYRKRKGEGRKKREGGKKRRKEKKMRGGHD
jgi:hypothetical protein